MTFLYVVHVYMFCNVVLYCIALPARVLFAIKIIIIYLNLNNAFNPLLYKSSLTSAELPLELRYTPKYLYPFALSIGTLFTLNILSWSFPVLLNTTDLVFFIFRT